MKKFGIQALTALLIASGANAAEIGKEIHDRLSGKASSGSDRKHGDSGTVKIVRSPHRYFVAGEQVEIRGNRPHPAGASRATALADANDGTRPFR